VGNRDHIICMGIGGGMDELEGGMDELEGGMDELEFCWKTLQRRSCANS